MNMYTQVEDLERILVMNKLKYKKEIAIKELKNKRFDYYLPKHKLFIEFDGAQHHYPVEHFGGNDRYIQQVFDDAEKTMWCKHNGYKFLRLNHLMSMETMISLINDVIEMEITINEEDVRLPHIDEWAELNLNQKDLYINELYKNYNKFLKNILGENYKLNEIIPFEDYILNYNDNIEYKGIIQYKNQYTKHYINHNIEEVNKNEKIITQNNIIELFVKHLDEIGILEQTHLPSFLIYEYYTDWFENNNFNNKLMRAMEFGQRFSIKVKKIGYTKIERKRLQQITEDQFNFNLLTIDYLNIDQSLQTTVYIKQNNNLTSNDIINIFLDNLKEKGILNYSYIPTKPMYEYYKDWLEINNFKFPLIENREFSQKLNKKLKEFGYSTIIQKRINKIKRYEFNNQLLIISNKSNFYNMMQTNEPTKILINNDLLFNDDQVSEVTDILLNTEEFNQLNNYGLPLIQYAIEILSKNKLSLLANLESLDKMYLLSKDELIEKLNM